MTRAALLRCTAITTAILVAGCKDFQAARQQEDAVAATAAQAHTPDAPIVSTVDQPYLIGEPIKDQNTVPDILRAPASILIARPIALRDAAIQAERLTHIPVSVSPDADEDDDGGDTSAALPPPTAGFNGTSLPPPPGMGGAASMPSGATRPHVQLAAWHGPGAWLQYEGTRDGVFRAVATRFGVSQEFLDGHINFFRNKTKTFVVPVFNAQTENSSTISAVTGGGSQSGGSGGGVSGGGGAGGGSSSGSGSSSGMLSMSRDAKVDRWANLQKTATLVADGGNVVADKELGTLSVTGTPEQIARVSDWMDGLSESLMRQVAVDIHVYTLKFNHESNYGWSPQVALKNYGKVYGLALTPATIPAITSGDVPFSFGASILNTATGAAGQFSGSQAAVSALAELGNVTEVYSRAAVTTNGVTAPFQNGLNQTYLQSSSAVLAANAGAATTLQPGVVMSGFAGEITPKVVGDRIMLHLGFTLQTLLTLSSYSSGGSSLQEPLTNSTAMDDDVVLHSGSTLMLSGYVDDSTNRKRNGVGSPLFWVLGGGGDAQTQKTQVIVTVEARTL